MIWRFHHPWLLLLLLIPLVMLLIQLFRKQKSARVVYSDLGVLDGAPVSLRLRILPFMPLLRFFALAFIIMALARPQYGRIEAVQSARGIDISMVLDISSTMDQRDYKPTRLRVARDVMTDFIQDRINDRIGVIIFGTSPYVLVPSSFDHESTVNYIERIDDFLYGVPGSSARFPDKERLTAIGSGLALAVDQLRESEAESRVVIMLTDGENTAGQIAPLTAAEIARKYDIRVYTIGLLAKSYNRRSANFDQTELAQIADITGGKFFSASNEAALASIYEEIDELEKTDIETSVFDNFGEKFMIFLGPGLILLGLESLLRIFLLRRLP